MRNSQRVSNKGGKKPTQRPVSEGRDTSYKTAEMVKLISEIGPDIPEISRRLGQYKESVRYRY